MPRLVWDLKANICKIPRRQKATVVLTFIQQITPWLKSLQLPQQAEETQNSM